MKIKVSELIVRYMERLSVDAVFGIPGAHILPVYDALHGSKIRTVLAKHEQGAAFMAGGHARASGRIGACIATAGPGATNLVTGIANAYADRQPVLAITGETSTHIFGRGGLQESTGEGGTIDQAALFASITKYRRTVERTDYLAAVLNQASDALLGDSPGPVLLSLPFNLQKETVDAAILDEVKTERTRPACRANDAQIEALAALIRRAERPVILAGHGCLRSGAQDLLARMSEAYAMPVATSLKGKGAFDERSALSLGTLGVTSGGHAFNHISAQADLLIVLGASYNERTSHAWDRAILEGKRLVQVDADPHQLGKTFRPDLAIAGDVRETLAVLLDKLPALPSRAAAAPTKASNGRPSILGDRFDLVERFFAALERRFPTGVRIYDDNIVFAQSFLRLSPGNRYHPNSGISSLGHAIPAAIGGRLADPSPVFAILGDGGFQMCCMELMTAVNYRLPLTVILFNNATMGLIRKNQCQQYGARYIDCDFQNPDYALLARSFGIAHRCIEAEADIEPTFDALDFEGGINLVEIVIDRDAFPAYQTKR